jgi:hypothetical protein
MQLSLNYYISQLLQFQRNNHDEKKNDQERQENELDKGVDEGVELCALDSSVTKKHQRYRSCQHTLKN